MAKVLIFTDDQAASLNAYQGCVMWHPFTCGTNWAHGFMADWPWRECLDPLHKALLEAAAKPEVA